jgi:putative ABC transport system substrate-binding protein
MNPIRRRAFLVASSALLAAPLSRAQRDGRTYRVGTLFPFGPAGGKQYIQALRERLGRQGFIEGRNLAIAMRHAYWHRNEAEKFAREHAAGQVDAIFALSSIVAQGALDATRTVPIVFAWVADPVVSGIVKAYARPGGNATGVSNRFFELHAKRLELARELVPGARRVAVVAGVFDATLEAAWKHAEPVAAKLELEPIRIAAGGGRWYGAARDARSARTDVIVVTTPFAQFGAHDEAKAFVNGAAEQRIPVVYSDADTVEEGGLVSYATNLLAEVGRGADVLARVLKGESPATLPVDQSARFELVVNLKAAQAIGFKVPPAVLVRADRVIG